MTATEAPAGRALLREASRKWKGRDCASDGILSSDAHKKQNPTSRHDLGDAVDLTRDLSVGLDTWELADRMRERCAAGKEDRIDEIISNGRIATAKRGWVWRRYRGANRHDKHVHFSLRHGRRNDVSPFFAFLDITTEPAPIPVQPSSPEEDMPVIARVKGERTQWLTDLLHAKRSLDDAAEVAALKKAGVRDIGEVPASLLADVPTLKG